MLKTGQRFGKLTVVKETAKTRKERRWECLCDCGKTMFANTNTLTSGHSSSCGCGRLEAITNSGKHVTGTWHGIFQRNAKKRGFEFNLTLEFLDELWDKQSGLCALSGLPIKIERCRSGKKYYSKTTASLDRIDNTKGYTEDNVQFVHKHINYMKWTHSQDYFIELCKMVASYDKPSNVYNQSGNALA